MTDELAPRPTLGLRYDLRIAPHSRPAVEQYRAALEQCAWAEEHGFGSVTLSEHHTSEDGYLPSPMMVASAIAGVTSNLRVMIGALLGPLYEPLRLAEDIAVLDLLSEGRVDYIIGAGYRREEFDLLDKDYEGRGRYLEVLLPLLRQAWTGEAFEYDGRTVRVTPTPYRSGGPVLMLAGASKGAARRAARIADGFLPVDPSFYEAYVEECTKIGRDPGPLPGPQGPMFLHVAEDPDAAWAKIAPSALHETNSYGQWLSAADNAGPYAMFDDADALRASGAYQVVTPDECVAIASGVSSLSFHPLMGGLDPDVAWESLELFADKVLPRLGEAPTSP